MQLKDFVTVFAATIAAIASLATLALNLRAQLRAELRVAQRKFLEPHVLTLGEALHNLLASSYVLLDARSDESRAKWLERAQTEQARIKELIPKLRYPLWGLDSGLRALTRLPDWVYHRRGDSAQSAELLAAADALRLALDESIQGCYAAGRRPTWLERRRVERRARAFRAVFERTSPRRAASPAAAEPSAPVA